MKIKSKGNGLIDKNIGVKGEQNNFVSCFKLHRFYMSVSQDNFQEYSFINIIEF